MKYSAFASVTLSGVAYLAAPTPEADKVMAYIRESYPHSIKVNQTDQGDLIGVPHPFNSPCANSGFSHLFYWDTYFLNVGLIRLGMLQQAKNNTDDLLFLADKLGFVPNANSRSMSNRSQPPLLALMARDIFAETGDREWLKGAYAALVKEHEFWMTKRITPLGLNRYYNSATPAELADFYRFLARHRFKRLSIEGASAQIKFSSHLLSEAESGWDFTPRFEQHCNDYCPVDLNSFLYLEETILGDISKVLENNAEATWREKASQRKALIQEYLWNDAAGCYTDYDFENKKKGNTVSCAMLLPLLAGIATKDQAAKVVARMRNVLEYDHGLATCEKRPSKFAYQWNYPNGWPPLQGFAIQALDRYGFKEDARRLAEKYVHMVAGNFEKTGGLWEKYNVVSGTTDVVDEYKMPQMLGWTAGVFAYAVQYLNTQEPATP